MQFMTPEDTHLEMEKNLAALKAEANRLESIGEDDVTPSEWLLADQELDCVNKAIYELAYEFDNFVF